MTLLTVDDLGVEYPGGVRAVRGVSLDVHDGECLALIGESGCGKTTLVRAALGLLASGAIATGSVLIDGTQIIGTPDRRVRALRGSVVGLVAQDPFAALDPTRSVGHHVAEAWRAHGRRPGRYDVEELLEQVGIDAPGRRARQRPYAWSGGMLQRAQVAAATALRPQLLIADEPTSALDADRADEILMLINARARGVLLISHDLRAVRAHATRIAVMYAGRIVEHLDTADITAARHPYTRALLAASPQPGAGLPDPLPGEAPRLDAPDAGCAFAARCPGQTGRCLDEVPSIDEGVACHHPS